jgi:hypothetical protein
MCAPLPEMVNARIFESMLPFSHTEDDLYRDPGRPIHVDEAEGAGTRQHTGQDGCSSAAARVTDRRTPPS